MENYPNLFQQQQQQQTNKKWRKKTQPNWNGNAKWKKLNEKLS